MFRLRLVPVLTAVALVVLAGCGSSSKTSSTAAGSSTSSTSTAPSSAMTTVEVAKTSLGDVLTDAHGKTLYMLMKDANGKSTCNAGCASIWPALTVDGKPTAGRGVKETALGTITRDDGKTQVTYYGHPLYDYSGDSKAGDVKGQGIAGVWFAVTAEGTPAGSSSSSTTSSSS